MKSKKLIITIVLSLVLCLVMGSLPVLAQTTSDNPFAEHDSEVIDIIDGLDDEHVEDAQSNDAMQYSVRESQFLTEKKQSYIVQFRSDVSLTEIAELLKDYEYEIIGLSENRFFTVESDLSEKDFNTIFGSYATEILKNRVVKQVDEIESTSNTEQLAEQYSTFNDPYYPDQWYLNEIELPSALSLQNNAEEVYVAVIDSGIKRDHPDLYYADIRNGWDCVYDEYCNWDSTGHGTAVTSVIAAVTNNGVGIAAVAPKVAIIPIRIFWSDGSVYLDDLLFAYYVAGECQCDVVNCSFGGDFIGAEQSWIQTLYQNGTIVVAAAGNSEIQEAQYPASYSNVVSVGGSNELSNRAYFSTYGWKLDVLAPATNILVCNAYYDYPGEYEYVYADGTSFSAPIVSGLAALAVAYDTNLTPSQFETRLRQSATDIYSTGRDVYSGNGIVNANKLLHLLCMDTRKPAVTAFGGDGYVKLSWNDVAYATSYRILRYKPVTNSYEFVADTTETSYLHTGVTNGAKYIYVVRANDGVAMSLYDTRDHVTAVPVTTPNVTGVGATGVAKLSWNAVAGAKGYRIFQWDTATSSWKKIAQTTALKYNVTGLTNGTAYTYLVRAFTGYGMSEYDEQDRVTITPLAMPNFQIQTQDSSATLKWSAVTGATEYKIFRYRPYNGTFQYVGTTTELSYEVTGLKNGTKYGYIVRAKNETSVSNLAKWKVKYTIPVAAPNVTGNGTTKAAVLKWNAVAGAKGYRIFAYDGENYTKIAETTSLKYTVTQLNNAKSYTYLVRAFTGCGQSEFTTENHVTVMPLAIPSVQIQTQDSSATLQWSAVEGATEYKIFRYRPYNGSFQYVGTTTELSYEVTGLKNGTKYGYIVRAKNEIGVSNLAKWKVKYTIPVAQPNLKAKTATKTVTLTWNSVAGAKGYRIFQWDTATSSWKKIAQTTALKYNVTGLTNGNEYKFVVRAFTGYGQSVFTEEDTVSVTPLAMPNFSIQAQDSSATISWSAVEGATEYKIFRYKPYNKTFQYVGTTTELTYEVTGLTNGKSYGYIVRAKNSDGASNLAKWKVKYVTPSAE